MPDRIAEPAAALWMDGCDPDTERALLLRVVVDGECLILSDANSTIVPADGYETVMGGPEWARHVKGFKIGKSDSMRGGRVVSRRPPAR